MLQRQYHTLHVMQRQYCMLHVKETISQYNRRHRSLSSMCPILLINMYFRVLESAQSSGAWGKSLEGTASHGFWRLGGIWKVELREEYISCVMENMFAKTQSRTIWSQCKKKQWNKGWRELLPCSQKEVTMEIWQDVNGGKMKGVAKQKVGFLKTVAGIWRSNVISSKVV